MTALHLLPTQHITQYTGDFTVHLIYHTMINPTESHSVIQDWSLQEYLLVVDQWFNCIQLLLLPYMVLLIGSGNIMASSYCHSHFDDYSQYGSKVTVLSVMWWTVGAEYFDVIARSSPNLQEFYLRLDNNSLHMYLSSLSQHCQKLRGLNLSHTPLGLDNENVGVCCQEWSV